MPVCNFYFIHMFLVQRITHMDVLLFLLFPFWRTTEASARSTFFVLSKPDVSGFEGNDDNRKCKISYKKQDAFEKCFLHEVSEISDIPSA